MLSRLASSMLSIVIFIAFPCHARIWLVSPDQTGDAPTIQAAMDSATAGDEVVLTAGLYTRTNQASVEWYMLRLKAGVSLRGEEGTVSAVIDSEFQGACMFGMDVGAIRIANLTFTRGAGEGCAINLSGTSSPTIENNVFQGNNANGFGGAVKCPSGTVRYCQFVGNRSTFGSGCALYCENCLIENCVFKENGVTGDGNVGGAIVCRNAQIQDCWFEGNSIGDFAVGVGGAIYGENLTIDSCWFIGNGASGRLQGKGGAVFVLGTSAITGCVFIGNQADHGGAVWGAGSTTIEYSTFFGNKSYTPDGVGSVALDAGGTVNAVIVAHTKQGLACSGTSATWTCSNLFGNVLGDNLCGIDGGNNLQLDPEFCAADPVMSRNVGIQEDSPCAPGRHPEGADCGLIGAGPVACGPVNVQPSSWSAVKRMFR